MGNLLKSRIELLLSETTRKAAAISKAATGKPDTIRDIMRKGTIPNAETIQNLAKEFGVDVAYLTGRSNLRHQTGSKTTNGLVPVRLVGATQAGAFMEVAATSAFDDDPRWVAALKDEEFPDLELIAFEVVGDSINLKCEPGGFAICLPFAATGLQIKSGMWVIAERKQGDLVERTVKQVFQNGRGYELRPASTNKEWKPIRFPSADGRGHEEVTVVAIVRRFLGPPLPH